jgi:nickel transport protein
MSPSLPQIALSIACAWTLVFAPAYAHDLWIDRALLVHFGDVGERLDPVNPANLSGFVAFGADGKAAAARLLPIGEVGAVVLAEAGEPAAVGVVWDAGYRVKKGEKWAKATAEEAKAAGTFRHSVFHAKTIFTWNARFAEPFGLPLELVPHNDPTAVRAGGTLTLTALVDGKPAAGVVLTLDQPEVSLTSDAAGLITVPIAKAGLHLLSARLVGKEGDGDLSCVAVLAFRSAP